MRYLKTRTISFTDVNGKEYAIKDIRPIPVGVKRITVDVKESDRLDEIASREIVYKKSGEDQSYKLIDMNIVALIEAKFDLSRIKTLEIPV